MAVGLTGGDFQTDIANIVVFFLSIYVYLFFQTATELLVKVKVTLDTV
jgi:hypothetical protein